MHQFRPFAYHQFHRQFQRLRLQLNHFRLYVSIVEVRLLVVALVTLILWLSRYLKSVCYFGIKPTGTTCSRRRLRRRVWDRMVQRPILCRWYNIFRLFQKYSKHNRWPYLWNRTQWGNVIQNTSTNWYIWNHTPFRGIVSMRYNIFQRGLCIRSVHNLSFFNVHLQEIQWQRKKNF